MITSARRNTRIEVAPAGWKGDRAQVLWRNRTAGEARAAADLRATTTVAAAARASSFSVSPEQCCGEEVPCLLGVCLLVRCDPKWPLLSLPFQRNGVCTVIRMCASGRGKCVPNCPRLEANEEEEDDDEVEETQV